MRAARLPDQAGDLRRLLNDPRRLCELLGLLDGATPQSGGLHIKCPWHAEKNPSCSVTCGPDGTIRVKCFGCDATGDVLSLIAQVNGLSTARDFPKVLELAAELAGTSLDADLPPAPARRQPAAVAMTEYPPRDEVSALWESARPVTDDPETAAWLRSRGLDPAAIEDRQLARALTPDAPQLRWARKKSVGPWFEGGYRCLVPMFDGSGVLRSVRARRVISPNDGEAKALPPSGHRMTGLIMACAFGRQLLERGAFPHFWPRGADLQIAVMEGEPDFLKYGTIWPDSDLTAPAILGIVAGSWSSEIAARIPDGAEVVILTHQDPAGDKYAAQIIESLRGRVTLRRGPA